MKLIHEVARESKKIKTDKLHTETVGEQIERFFPYLLCLYKRCITSRHWHVAQMPGDRGWVRGRGLH